MPMDMKILAQVREQAAATDDLKAELSTAQQEREELRRQPAAVQQENERLRKQAGKMARIEFLRTDSLIIRWQRCWQ